MIRRILCWIGLHDWRPVGWLRYPDQDPNSPSLYQRKCYDCDKNQVGHPELKQWWTPTKEGIRGH